MRPLLNWIKVLFEEYKFARRFALFWAISLISYVVVFPGALSDAEFVATVGVLSVVIGFYQVHRSKDEP